MAEQPGKGRGKGRGDAGEAPRTDLPPKKEPYYEGYFGDEEDAGVERSAEEPGEGGAPREERGGIGEGPI